MLDNMIASILMLGFVYMIVAGQLYIGGPPFYRRWSQKADADHIRRFAPWLFALMGSLILPVLIQSELLLFIPASLAVWLGWQVRATLKNEMPCPQPWLINPMTKQFFSKWPMFLFDAWTIGLCLGFLVLTESGALQ